MTSPETVSFGALLDAIQRILATGHTLTIEQTGESAYVFTAQKPITDYGFRAVTHGRTVSHPIVDLADRIAPGAK